MKLDLVTAPAAEPISTAVAKAHLRVDFATDDTLIDSLVVAARQYVEQITGRALITQTWDLFLEGFMGQEIHIPNAPLQSVTSVKYIDTGGSEQTFSSDNYTVFTYSSHPGEVALNYNETWPATRRVENAVTVQFKAGYGDAGSNVPQPILQAMLLLVGHWYENRESTVAGMRVEPFMLPEAFDMLIAPYRILKV
jgi:uncharacterized phiE125 gp8 family phage protein